MDKVYNKVYDKDDINTIEKVNGTGKIAKITCRRYASNEIDNINFERKKHQSYKKDTKVDYYLYGNEYI